MEEERTKEVETWSEPQSVRVSEIVAPLTLILQTTNKSTDNKSQSTQAEKQDIPGNAGSTSSASSIDGAGVGNKNLSSEKSG